MRLSRYKERLISSLEDLKRALEEDDQTHVRILFERLERDILNRDRI